MENIIQVRPYTLKELSGLYGVTKPTIRKWIEPFKELIGERTGNYYNITQVRIIFEKLWYPATIRIDDEFKKG